MENTGFFLLNNFGKWKTRDLLVGVLLLVSKRSGWDWYFGKNKSFDSFVVFEKTGLYGSRI